MAAVEVVVTPAAVEVATEEVATAEAVVDVSPLSVQDRS
jgi:hypothetical protein